MSDFRTRIDYSNNRQIKQFQLTETALSGTTTFGLPYSGLTSGVDEGSIGTTSTLINIASTFTTISGESTTYTFGDPRMDVGIQGLTIITDANSGTTQTGYGFEGDEFIELDGNIVYQNYTGSTYDLYVTSIEEISPEVFSGTCQSDLVVIMSGGSIDFQGRTIWVDVQGITRTERLIITDELDILSGSTKVLTRDEDGNVHETYLTGHTDNDYVTGTTFNTSTGDLTSTRLSGGTIITNLDGRYLTAETDNQTLSFSADTGDLAISSGNTVNLDGRYSLTGHTHPSDDTDDFLTGHTFNTSTGLFESTLQSGSTVSVNLDGRYPLIGDLIPNTDDYVNNAIFNTSNGKLTLQRLSGGTVIVDLDNRYSLTGHTHDSDNTDDHLTGATFNTSDGILSLNLLSGSTVQVDLDDRYALTGHTHPSDNTDDYVTGSTFNTSTGILTLERLSGGTVTVDLDDRYIEWTGLWANTQYTVNQQALDGDYLGIANKTTEDRLAPQESSDKEYGITGTTASTESNISVVNSGHEYTFTESGWINELRVFVSEITSTTNYRVVVLDVTNSGSPISNIYESPLLEVGEWSTVTIGQRFVKPGSKFIVYIDALNSGSNSEVTGGWTRGVNSQSSAPSAESWNVTNQGDIVRIDKDDLNSTDRTSELMGIITDSILQFVETASPTSLVKYRTIAPPFDAGSYVEYFTVRIEEDLGGPTILETSTLTATIPIPQSTEYIEIVDYWLTNEPSWATIEGILEYNGVVQSGVTDNAYGVDIGFTAAYLSPDWDIISVNGGTGGSGGTGDQTLAFSASTGDLNISDGNTVNLDGRYSLTGHTHDTDNTDDFTTGATFNINTGDLEFTRQSGDTYNVNLDDRYSLTGHTHGISEITGFTDNSTNWDEAYDDTITGMTVTGTVVKTITLEQRDGGTISANFTDNIGGGGGGDVVTGMTFNTGDGVLTLNTLSGNTITEDLDGRYSLTGHTHDSDNTDDYTTGATFNSEIIEFTRLSGGTYTVDLSNTYSLTGHTHDSDNTDDFLTGHTFNTSTGLLESTLQSGSTVSVNLDGRYPLIGDLIPNTDDYVTSGSFNTSNGEVTLTRLSGGTVVYDLDGRYALSGDTSTNTDDYTTGATFNSEIIEFTRQSGDTYNVDLSNTYSLTGHTHDSDNTDDFLTGSTFNPSNGDLTLDMQSGSTFVTNFDGRYSLTGHTHPSDNTDDFLTGATFNTGDGILSLDLLSGGTVQVDLDGRYLTTETDSQTLSFSADTGDLEISNGNIVNLDGRYALTGDTIPNTDDYTTGATFNSEIIEFTRQSGDTYNVDLSNTYSLTGHTHASDNTDDYVTSGSFNSSTGDVTLTRLSGGTVVYNLDDRYSLTGHTHASDNTDDYVDSASFNTGDGVLTLNMISGGTVTVDLDNRYSLTGHTHIIDDITDFTDNSTNWDEAYGDIITGATFNTSDGVLSLIDRDSDNIVQVDLDGRYLTGFTESPDADDYVTSGSFNTSNGEVTLTRLSGGTVVYDLDGRYSLTGHTHASDNTDDFLTGHTFNTSTGLLESTLQSGSTVSINLDGRYGLESDEVYERTGTQIITPKVGTFTNTSNYSTIGGGDDIDILGGSDYSTIGGGRTNNVATGSTYTYIGGGYRNDIFSGSTYATISGGYNGEITDGRGSTIVGGRANTISGDYGFIGGGYNNLIEGPRITIVGGYNNTASAVYSTIGGGAGNEISINGTRGVIGGGQDNTLLAHYSTIGGGRSHIISGQSSFIGGGRYNTVSQLYSVVVGGSGNTTSDIYAFIGGGYDNSITDEYSTIGGGWRNTISGQYAFIGGGDLNTISGYQKGVIVGGSNNAINSASDYGAIVGGDGNTLDSDYTFIGGGYINEIMASANYSTISGGENNTISGGTHNFIGGGKDNIVATSYSSVIGGYNNTNTSLSTYGTSSGYQNTNNAWGGTAFGYKNNISNTLSGAFGDSNAVDGYGAFAFGQTNSVTGYTSFAGGFGNDIVTGSVNTVFGWDNVVNEGDATFVGGRLNIVTGTNGVGYNAVFGYNNAVTGDYSMVAGFSQTISGYGHTVFGGDNTSNNIVGYTLNAGRNNVNRGVGMSTLGLALAGASVGTTIIGQANIDYSGTTGSPNTATDPIFLIGNGTINSGSLTANVRSNAFSVLFDGTVTAPSITNTLINTAGAKSLVSLEYLQTYSGTTSGDDYVTSGSFNTGTGDLTLTRLSGGTVVENLDGRYGLESDEVYERTGTQIITPKVGTFTNTSNYSTISGGDNNSISGGTYGVIGGGSGNIAGGQYNTIGGGQSNITQDWAATIGGGSGNKIQNPINNTFGATISGGYGNTVSGEYDTIAGGYINTIINDSNYEFRFIGGGDQNSINRAKWSVIGGGRQNSINSLNGQAFIGGGFENSITGTEYHSIVGGRANSISAVYASTISGGYDNEIAGNYSHIGSGWKNILNSHYGTIGGGRGNVISGDTYITIGGGRDNTATGSYSSIGGGQNNTASGYYTNIAGGRNNNVSATSGFIGGGDGNLVEENFGVIGGGQNNSITGGTKNSILGGELNNVGHSNAHVIGSNITTTQTDTTFVEGLYIKNHILQVTGTTALMISAGNIVETRELGTNAFTSGSSPTALSGLTDTNITTPTIADVLTWDGLDWIASAATVSDMLTFDNGLLRTVDNVQLGGDLVKDTVVGLGSSNYYFEFLMQPSGQVYSESRFHNEGFYTNAYDNDTNTKSSITSEVQPTYGRVDLKATDTTGSDNLRIELNTVSGITVTDTVNDKGMVYADDYSAQYTDRSIVDKEYVDNAASTGGFSWEVVTGNTTCVGQTGYISNSASLITYTLPTTNTIETIRVTGKGSGGWQIDVPVSWTIEFVDEIVDDNLQSTSQGDAIELLCTGDNTWLVISSMGNITFNNL